MKLVPLQTFAAIGMEFCLTSKIKVKSSFNLRDISGHWRAKAGHHAELYIFN